MPFAARQTATSPRIVALGWLSGGAQAGAASADLIAAIRLWATAQHRTEDDVREEVELADDTALKNIVPELREGGGDDALDASRRLEAIAYAPSERLSEIFEVAQTVFPPSTANEPLWPDEDQ